MTRLPAILLPVLLSLSLPVPAAPLVITDVKHAEERGADAYVARAPYAPDFYLGFALLCERADTSLTVFLGGFPHDARPVQFRLIAGNGKQTVFGPRVRGGASAGFHSPRLTDKGKISEFFRLALDGQALVTNGYRGFTIQLPPGKARGFEQSLARCGLKGASKN